MRRVIIVLLLLILAFGMYWFFFRSKPSTKEEPKPEPIALKKNSAEFNNSIEQVIAEYLNVKDAFIESDTSSVKKHAVAFVNMLDKIPLEELKKDTSNGIYESMVTNVNDLKLNMTSIANGRTLHDMRQDFSMVTELLYPSFKLISYEGRTLYLQNCPMAFGEDKGANWISNTNEILNPYMGKKHPEYKATMLHCGEVMDSIKAN
jgi:hypothetical protein